MSTTIVMLNDANFEETVLRANKPAVIDLWAPWCAPCRMIAPIIQDLAEEYQEKILFGKLNVDDNPVMATKYGITSIPTLIFFKNGEAADRMIGVPAGNAKKIIENKVKSLLD